MKASELTVGDWVCYDGDTDYECPLIVDGVSVDDVSIEGEGFLGGIEGVVIPIPLTEEILKANGFTIKTTDYSFIKIGNEIIISFHFGKTLRITDYNKGFEIGHAVKKIWHVHELQHALRLCGINDLADNFKVI